MGISIVGSSAAALFTRAEILTSSGTWTHPDGASAGSPKTIYVIVSGGGCGGAGAGAGNPGSTSTAAMSGYAGGGSSGTVNENFMIVTGSVNYTIGAGGAGGAGGVNTSNGGTTSGNPGNPGGTTNFNGLAAIGGGIATIYGARAATTLDPYIATSGSNGGWANPSLGGSIGGSASGQNHVTGTSGAQSPRTNSTPPGNGFSIQTTESGYTMYYSGQANYFNGWAVSQIGGQYAPRHYYPFSKRTALVAGGGGQSAWGQTSTSSYTNTSVGSGANGYLGKGGDGGNQVFATSGPVTGGVGAAGAGYGSGGGGGGPALGIGSATCTGGAGGAGANGVVIILY
jgi:hypothetical protein